MYREMIFGSIKVDPNRVNAPMFVAGGVLDRVVSEQLSRFTATRYGAELVMYPERAHWLFEEPGWERVADDVADWLDRVLALGAHAGMAQSA